jgi:hypothetical protein
MFLGNQNFFPPSSHIYICTCKTQLNSTIFKAVRKKFISMIIKKTSCNIDATKLRILLSI